MASPRPSEGTATAAVLAAARRPIWNEIAAYIARDNPARAATCRGVARLPLSYPARDDLAAGVRMAVFRR